MEMRPAMIALVLITMLMPASAETLRKPFASDSKIAAPAFRSSTILGTSPNTSGREKYGIAIENRPAMQQRAIGTNEQAKFGIAIENKPAMMRSR
jgi:hypothetical protein